MSGPPPPPPPPVAHLAPADREALIADLKRQRKDDRNVKAKQAIGRLNGRHWGALAAIGGLAVLAVGCNQYASMQSATLNAQATQSSILAAVLEPTATSQPPTVSGGMDNPLELLPLTEQARWSIALSSTKREDGEFALQPGRSAVVVAQLMRLVDPCKLWVSVDDERRPVVASEQSPGAVPMAVCAPPTTTTTKPAQ